MLRESQILLLSVTLQFATSNVWVVETRPCFSFQLLTSHDVFVLGEAEDLLWHKQVPLKVSIFVWHLLRDRLPTKTNLDDRGIISSDLHFCVSGCGGVESTQHLFLSCSSFGSLWALVRSCFDFSAVDTHDLSDHFLQFTFSPGGTKARQSFLQLI
ncbi:hypothetical protein QL285_009049 [Trifolium repens]|nr:hypothetical protein QL285_009049 [Trifolium repens]